LTPFRLLPWFRLTRPIALMAFLQGPAPAGRGDLHLDLGAGPLVREGGQRPAMAGNMAFRFGANRWTELGLGVDYGRFLHPGGARRMELSGLSLAAFLTPYPGRLQPLVGGHLGMVRVEDRWRMDLGLETRVLAALGRGFQAYAAVDPGLWLGGDGTAAEIRVRLGLGLRVPLGI
jgi:hypothetical protein